MDNFLFFLIFGLSNRHAFLDYLMVVGAEYVIYATLILIFLVALKGKIAEKKSLILFLFSLPVLILIIKIIHIFIFKDRPFVAGEIIPLVSLQADASFPSRHTAVMAAAAFSFAFFKSRWYSLFLCLAAWVGFSRVYVGVHYPLDILGGFIVGFSSVLISKRLILVLKTKLF